MSAAAELRPPVARGLPIVGHIGSMARDPVSLALRLAREHGPLVRIPLGPGAMTLVAHPDDMRHVLQENHKNYVRGRSVDLVRPMLGNGLPLSDPPLWLRQRRIMQPAFGRARIAAMASVMTDVAVRWAERLEDRQELDTHDLMMRITRDVIVETMFGSSLGDDVPALDHALEVIERYVARYAFVPFKVPLWLPTPDNRAFRAAIATLDRLVKRMTRARRAAGEPRDDLLGALLSARDVETGETMPDAQLRDEIVNIFFAGHETTANALTWTTFLLSEHAEVRARMTAEIDNVLAGRAPGADDIARLPYTGAVLREALRLYPPAWMFARVAEADDSLRGHRIAAGDVLMIAPYVTHRLKEFWPDPDRFDPERFLRDPSLGIGGTKTFAYVPFGGGPHVCIGNHFAMSEALLVLAVLAQRVRLVVLRPDRVRPRASATLRVAGSLPVRVELRAR